MYILIAGCGSTGASLAGRLYEAGHNVVVIDEDAESFSKLGSGCNCITLTGLPIDNDILIEAGIERADALAAVTSDDNMNIMISQIARLLYHVPVVITRTHDPQREEVWNTMGLDIVCPTSLAVDNIFHRLSREEH